MEEDTTLAALAEAIRVLSEYREITALILERPTHYVKRSEQDRLAFINQAVEAMEKTLLSKNA